MSLLSLPNELLIPIVRFPIDEAEPYVGSESFEFLGRRDLLSLVKTNRRLNAIATPLLYHTISVHSVDALIELLVTFFLSPHLAAHVNVLGLFVERYLPSKSFRSHRAKARLASAGTPLPSSAHEDLCRLVDPDIPWPRGGEGVVPACTRLLRQTINLQTLSIDCLPLRLYGDTTDLAGSLRQLYNDPHADFLPHLERLCLTVPLDVDGSHVAPQGFMGRPNGIKRLDQFGGIMSLLGRSFDPEPWKNLETIRLSNVKTTGGSWFRMCRDALPRLRHIDIRAAFEPLSLNFVPNRGYNEALQLCAPTLERLTLNLGLKPCYMTDLGPAMRLSCLVSMERLTYLDISAMLLFSSEAAMGQGNICDTLPRSLEWLHLREDGIGAPWLARMAASEPFSHVVYGRLLVRAMQQLIFEGEGRLPRLQELQLTRFSVHWISLGPELDAIAIMTADRNMEVREWTGKVETTRASIAVQEARASLAETSTSS